MSNIESSSSSNQCLYDFIDKIHHHDLKSLPEGFKRSLRDYFVDLIKERLDQVSDDSDEDVWIEVSSLFLAINIPFNGCYGFDDKQEELFDWYDEKFDRIKEMLEAYKSSGGSSKGVLRFLAQDMLVLN